MKVDYLTRSGAINMALGAIALALFANSSAVAADIPIDSLKFAPRVVRAPAYETPAAPGYIVANGTNIFSDHAFYGTNVMGELKRGEKPEVLAKVKGWEWVLIGKQGVGVGYVATSMLSPEDRYVPTAADIPVGSLKFAPGVVKAPAYETPAAPSYIVANGTNIFSDHAFYGANVTGELKRGEKPEVLAKVKGWEWVLIGKQGTGVGYVATSMLSPADKYVPSATGSAAAANIPAGSLKLAPGVVKASGYEKPVAPSYIVANSTNMFSDHAFYGTNVTGELKRGERPEVLAKVKGWEWVLIGKQGTGVGYVATSMLSPADKYVR